ncbi:MAG: hypothetical protein ABGX27_04950, partial [Desulfurobacteriaceae bacterium]
SKEEKVLLSLSMFYASSPLIIWSLRILVSNKIPHYIGIAFLFSYITFLSLSCALLVFHGLNNNPEETYRSLSERFEIPILGFIGSFIALSFTLSPKLRKYIE